jgi:hypothetical protein
LYRRVQTHDLCHLLEGINNPPVPDITSKRGLCGQITQLYIEYPRIGNEARSHITHSVQRAIASLPPSTRIPILSRGQTDWVSRYATLSLEAAVQLNGEARLLEAIQSGKRARLIALINPIKTLAKRRALRAGAHDDRSFARPDNEKPSHEGDIWTPLPSLQVLIINSRKLHVPVGSLEPDARSSSALDRIAPNRICCYIDDTNPMYAIDDFHRLPAATVLPANAFANLLAVAPSARISRLCVHIDPRIRPGLYAYKEHRFPVLTSGSTRWLLDTVGGDDSATGNVVNTMYVVKEAIRMLGRRSEPFDIDMVILTACPSSSLGQATREQLAKSFKTYIATDLDYSVDSEANESQEWRRGKCRIRFGIVTEFPACDSWMAK